MTGDTTFCNTPAISLLPVTGISGILLAPHTFATVSEPPYPIVCGFGETFGRDTLPSPPHRGHVCDPG